MSVDLICFIVFERTECIEAGLEDAWRSPLNQRLMKSIQQIRWILLHLHLQKAFCLSNSPKCSPLCLVLFLIDFH